jgi:hypothetical protein
MLRLASFLVTLLIISCSEPAPAPAAPEPTPIPVAADRAGEAPAPEGFVDTDPSPLTREEIIGMWGLRAQCGQPTIFSGDGTLADYTGQTGQWSLQGDSLTITKGGQTHTSEINPLNANAFTSAPPEDGSGRTRLFVIYQRC